MTDEEDLEPPFVVVSRTDIPDLTASPRSVIKKATALGWDVRVQGATTHHEDLLLMNDGKTGQRGEVKTPAHDKTHVWVSAKMPGARIGFVATYCDAPSAAAIHARADRSYYSRRWLSAAEEKLLKLSLSFVDATIHDVLGFPIENYATYKAPRVNREKDEAGWAHEARIKAAEEHAQRQDYEYNDCSVRTQHTIYTKKAGDLTDFLNDYLSATTERSMK